MEDSKEMSYKEMLKYFVAGVLIVLFALGTLYCFFSLGERFFGPLKKQHPITTNN